MMRVSVVILQARTTSTRLPAKVLLPINGLPLAILAAKRAANTGRATTIATSCDPSDDALVEIAASYGIRCMRGSLNNVLERFVTALEDYESDTLVFRLTADNVFPDGALLDEIEEEFIARNLDYLCCNGIQSGLPYGMSVEIMRVKHLREALSETNNSYDIEHVTPYIRRKYGEVFFEKYKVLNKGRYRCTVDSLDDYILVQKIFSRITDPIHTTCFELISQFDFIHNQFERDKSAAKMVLGSAQLGMFYGIANQTGKPNKLMAESIIEAAIYHGVSYIDTARSYGNSEELIGEALASKRFGHVKIITKLAILEECASDAQLAVINAFVDSSIFNSCFSLNTRHLDVVMLHRASHISDWGGAVWCRLNELKAKGLIGALGVSVQTPQELYHVLRVDEVNHIQMPFNILDDRWDEIIPLLKEIKLKRSLTVHVRSVLLQGLLVSNNADHWRRANVVDSEVIIEWLKDKQISMRCNTMIEFCLRYVKSMEWVDGVVIGVETLQQLNENLTTFGFPDFSSEEILELLTDRPKIKEITLNPALWLN